MNPNSRTIKVIERSLHRVEQAAGAAAGAAQADEAALDALGLLDEIRRLERKWQEQVAAQSPRRKPTDYLAMEGWCRRWLAATAKVAAAGVSPGVASALSQQRAGVERDLASGRLRAASAAMDAGRGDDSSRNA